MQSMDRRKFLGVVGASAGSALAVAATGSSVVSLASHSGTLRFRAEGGAPSAPWPAYATAVVEGSVDVKAGTGLVAARFLAGSPGAASDIALPGLTRMVRVTKVDVSGSQVRLAGVVEDRSTLQKGESREVRVLIDHASHSLHTTLAGQELTLGLV